MMDGVETKIVTAVIGDNLNPTVFCRQERADLAGPGGFHELERGPK
jgi:hypothetical protein